MNLLNAVYCNQYAELKRTNSDTSKGRTNGIILIAAMIIVNLVTLFILFGALGKFSESTGLNKFAASLGGGRSAGKLIAIVLFALIGSAVYLVMGKPAYYNALIQKFETLGPAEQKKIEKKGMTYVLGSVFGFIAIFILSLFLS